MVGNGFKPKLDFSKIEDMTGKDVLKGLTVDERQYFVEKVKSSTPPEQFKALTEDELNTLIITHILFEAGCSEFEFFNCFITKKTANFIRRQAEYYGTNEGLTLENLLECCSVKDPELAAVLSIMNINHITKDQTDEQKIRAMFIVAGALINHIINIGKYTLDEALHETENNFHEFRRVVDAINKANEE